MVEYYKNGELIQPPNNHRIIRKESLKITSSYSKLRACGEPSKFIHYVIPSLKEILNEEKK